MGQINSYTEQTVFNDTDEYVLQETAGGTTKKSLWSTFKSTLKTYFDTLYGDLTDVSTNTTNISNNSPAGIILSYAGAAAPTGWLICQGATVGNAASGATYAGAGYEDLFDIIKGGWGNAGTEVFADDDTVVLPDLRGAFLRGSGDHGSGTMADGNPFSGPSVGSSEDDQVQGHWHEQWAISNLYGPDNATRLGFSTGNPATTQAGTGYVRDSVTDGTNGTPRTGDETRPFNFGVNYIIKF